MLPWYLLNLKRLRFFFFFYFLVSSFSLLSISIRILWGFHKKKYCSEGGIGGWEVICICTDRFSHSFFHFIVIFILSSEYKRRKKIFTRISSHSYWKTGKKSFPSSLNLRKRSENVVVDIVKGARCIKSKSIYWCCANALQKNAW